MPNIILNKKHFFNNLDIIADLTSSKDKIALVLKDNAYGHGLCFMAKAAQEYGIQRAIVQLESEAKEIEEFFEYVLVLADIPKNPYEKIRYTINALDTIENYPKGTKVELKVNTGMNRNGIEIEQLYQAFSLIKKQGLKLEAVFTHHGCADEENHFFNLQKQNFLRVKEEARRLAEVFSFSTLRFHSCNSAALFREEKFDEDMVRVGIAAYGCLELPFASRATELQAVLSLYAQKISTRKVHTGSCIGYGASFLASEELLVSSYDFGYGNGFLRSCSNSYITPKGIKLLGRISMDNASFLSDEEELLIFNDASKAAKFANTISYEILSSLKAHIPRKFI